MYLLARDVPKTREEIWRDTGLYAPDGTTDRRTLDSARASFERDKALIRNLGVRITESMEHDGATSYTIRPRDYILPDLQLTADEQLALRLAAARVDNARARRQPAAARRGQHRTATTPSRCQQMYRWKRRQRSRPPGRCCRSLPLRLLSEPWSVSRTAAASETPSRWACCAGRATGISLRAKTTW